MLSGDNNSVFVLQTFKLTRDQISGSIIGVMMVTFSLLGECVMSGRKIVLVMCVVAVISAVTVVSMPTKASWMGNAWRNFESDFKCSCLGPTNDVINFLENGPPGRFLKGAQHDLQQGPGEHNDILGRKGFVRQRLGI